MYLKSNEPNVASVLTHIAGNIPEDNELVNLYLDHAWEYEVENPFQRGNRTAGRMSNQPMPDRFWERLGIRRIVSNIGQGRMEIGGSWQIDYDREGKVPYRWNTLKNSLIIEGLKTLLGGSSIIQFEDWAKTDDASGFGTDYFLM